MPRYHHFIHVSKFSGQSGRARLSDGRSITWSASGRIGTTPKYGGYPVDATIYHGETVLFDGTAADANEWLAKHGASDSLDAPVYLNDEQCPRAAQHHFLGANGAHYAVWEDNREVHLLTENGWESVAGGHIGDEILRLKAKAETEPESAVAVE